MADLAPETCEACGREFGCGAISGSCWCSTEDVPPAVLTELSERYSLCLCPACLVAAAEGSLRAPLEAGSP